MGERHISRLPFTRLQLGTKCATPACALVRHQTGDHLAHKPVLSPLSHTGQGRNMPFEVRRRRR